MAGEVKMAQVVRMVVDPDPVVLGDLEGNPACSSREMGRSYPVVPLMGA